MMTNLFGNLWGLVFCVVSGTIDVVVVNLYPFYSTVTSSNVEFDTGVENIDIGGPSMIRAAAKVR